MGLAVVAVLGATAGGVAGCAAEGGPAGTFPRPVPVRTTYPAAAAGGACQLLDYAVIRKILGAQFDLAAASRSGGTSTCVVQAGGVSRPDLSLSVTKTTADATIYEKEAVPDGSTAVKGLGQAAYQIPVAPVKGAGAGVEVGWLSKDGRIMTLCYTLAAGKGTATAVKALPKLVALAKAVDAVHP
jgi:hypothetical protein